MVPPRVLSRHPRRASAERDSLQLSGTVVPLPGASMRLLEIAVAGAAFAVAVLLGVAR